jgi:anthranilate synthase component 1
MYELYPNQERFQSLSQTYNVISIQKKVLLDTETPISIYRRFEHYDEIFLLESSPGHDRYSYIGFDNYKTITCHDSHVEISTGVDNEVSRESGNVFEILERLNKRYQSPPDDINKYTNGIVGFLTYECVQYIEKIQFPPKRTLELPMAKFILPRNIIVLDHLDHSITVVRNVFLEEGDAGSELVYDKECSALLEVMDKLLQPLATVESLEFADDDQMAELTTNITRDVYLHNSSTCKEYICDGDIFQIQLSRRISTAYTGSTFDLYRYLRHINPSPFMFFIKFKEECLVGASPELLVKVEDHKMYLRPIAGTRKRNSSDRPESEIIHELKNDPKEKAEHIMLVDLARNEVARVCKAGSVRVTELMGIEKYSHVIHMVSYVEGEMQDQYDSLDALKSSFPAGTVTGAPKIRAMEIISELETEQREFYAGGILFMDFQGNLKSSITIRSMLVKDGKIHTQAAAGTVYDSIPEMEYLETENKMKACLTTMSKKRTR